MKGRISALLDKVKVSKQVAVAVILCGLLAVTQEQNKGASVPQSSTEASPLVGVTNSTQNPLQIALLHWYNTNLTTTFDVGTVPYGVAFDGANIWVANSNSGTVSKL